jgi:hypothetical protein
MISSFKSLVRLSFLLGIKGNLVIESDGHLSILQAILTNTLNHHVFGAKIKKKNKESAKNAFFLSFIVLFSALFYCLQIAYHCGVT